MRISDQVDQLDSNASSTSALQRLTEEALIHLSTATGKGATEQLPPAVSRTESNLIQLPQASRAESNSIALPQASRAESNSIALPQANSRAQSILDIPPLKATDGRGESLPLPQSSSQQEINREPRVAVPARSIPETQTEKAPATPPRDTQTPKPEQPSTDKPLISGNSRRDVDVSPAEKEKLESKPNVTDSTGRLTKYTDHKGGVYKFEYANGTSGQQLSRVDLPDGKSIRISPKSGAAVRFNANGEPEKLLATDAKMRLVNGGFDLGGSRPGDDYFFHVNDTENSLEWQLQHKTNLLDRRQDKTVAKVDQNGRVESIDDDGRKYTFQWDQKNRFEMTKFIGPDGNGFEKIDGVVFSLHTGTYKAETEVGGKILPQESGVKVFNPAGPGLIRTIPSENKAWQLMLVRRNFAETQKK